MTELPLLRFIPFRRSDLTAMCLAEGRLDGEAVYRFHAACVEIERAFQQDFHSESTPPKVVKGQNAKVVDS